MVRMTYQKKILYEEVKHLTSFLNAYELQAKATKKDKKIGLATTYRFLNTLEKEGEIHSFSCNDKKIYSNKKTSHAHFTCEKCGKLKHIILKNVDFLSEVMEGEVCHFQIELKGICSGCKT